LVLAAEPVARGYCRNDTRHVAHRRAAVLVKLEKCFSHEITKLAARWALNEGLNALVMPSLSLTTGRHDWAHESHSILTVCSSCLFPQDHLHCCRDFSMYRGKGAVENTYKLNPEPVTHLSLGVTVRHQLWLPCLSPVLRAPVVGVPVRHHLQRRHALVHVRPPLRLVPAPQQPAQPRHHVRVLLDDPPQPLLQRAPPAPAPAPARFPCALAQAAGPRGGLRAVRGRPNQIEANAERSQGYAGTPLMGAFLKLLEFRIIGSAGCRAAWRAPGSQGPRGADRPKPWRPGTGLGFRD
jgi:hypothetical protein